MPRGIFSCSARKGFNYQYQTARCWLSNSKVLTYQYQTAQRWFSHKQGAYLSISNSTVLALKQARCLPINIRVLALKQQGAYLSISNSTVLALKQQGADLSISNSTVLALKQQVNNIKQHGVGSQTSQVLTFPCQILNSTVLALKQLGG